MTIDSTPSEDEELPDAPARAVGGRVLVVVQGSGHEVDHDGPNATGVPAGTRVTVLRRGTVRRGAATLSCVRFGAGIVNLGWTFVTDAERARCTPVAR